MSKSEDITSGLIGTTERTKVLASKFDLSVQSPSCVVQIDSGEARLAVKEVLFTGLKKIGFWQELNLRSPSIEKNTSA